MNKPILVVDDSAIGRMLLCKILARIGYTTEAAANGQEAVSIFELGKYAAIFMNLVMPVMDGHAATKEIRKKDTQITIIATSADCLARDKSIASGMNDFITLPARTSDIVEGLMRNDITVSII